MNASLADKIEHKDVNRSLEEALSSDWLDEEHRKKCAAAVAAANGVVGNDLLQKLGEKRAGRLKALITGADS